MMIPSSLSDFSVRRQQAVLVAPAKPTPHELKPLSDIDDQAGLRFVMPALFFYRAEPSMAGRDPAKVIREALAKTLVFYYPFAGRVREGPAQKLFVDCTGEGVMFVEADANVRIQDFGDDLPLPTHVLEDLICETDVSSGVLNSPIFLIQVTRLVCGGFVLALQLNHTMCDASGLVLFMKAIAEMALGATTPSVRPVWARELLSARNNPPRLTHAHPEYEEAKTETANSEATWLTSPMVQRSLFFGSEELSALRNRLPPRLRRSSAFEILTACIWRSRTMALQYQNEEEVRVICVVNARNKFRPALPAGYYGNALAFVAAISNVRELCEKPLGYALELVKKAKDEVTDDYMRSVADLMVMRGRPQLMTKGGYFVSDVTRMALGEINFGWGAPLYGGPGRGSVGEDPGFSSFFIRFRNSKGEDGILVQVSLPPLAMQRFLVDIESMTKDRLTTTTTIHHHFAHAYQYPLSKL
ncbi:hypothetical protein J5N97_024883 [Dioscorea zingiberensis]|uniref:Benzyl alcohol O-benzoyltransferase n=1 Tax=Dioscorea zingiberensis TaxID=325984 RepID=A0A9D5H906_9LILI|nr:hypothetical protein J5N97_024883 [Dioscorea zingiberensis]